MDKNSLIGDFRLRGRARRCLEDGRLVPYFDRGLVQADKVFDELMNGDFIKASKKLDSYADYRLACEAEAESERSITEIIDSGAVNRKTVYLVASVIAWILILITEIFNEGTPWSFLAFAVGVAPLFLAGVEFRKVLERRGEASTLRTTLFFGAGLLVTLSPYVFFDMEWRLIKLPVVLVTACWSGFLLGSEATLGQFANTIYLPVAIYERQNDRKRVDETREDWLDDAIENAILPHAIYVINTFLGDDHDKLLVEQDSEGLKRLHDPELTVSTGSQRRVEAALSRVDGGSIAISGPRGAGKSTLLRVVCGSQEGLCVYVAAPAEYVPRDFLVELFQRICESYIEDQGYDSTISLSRAGIRKKKAFRVLRDTSLTTLRSVIAIGLIGLVMWSLYVEFRVLLEDVMATSLKELRELWTRVPAAWEEYWVAVQVIIFVLALILWPGRRRWRDLRRHSEPPLVNRARQNLFRLQIDRTTTLGSSAGLSGPMGASIGLSKSASLKYLPWTFPELVGNLRRFMEAVSEEQRQGGKRLVVAIDEIDRIGSTENAERFISEVKAIFGVDNCYFLVSVAEDVGAAFGQRSILGRSMFENAFDEVVSVEALSLEESRELLLRRVPGFTTAFVFLVYSLSGGLPRELIRVTRRLVEINQDLRSPGYSPHIEELANALFKEELTEVLIGARNQLSKLTPSPRWAPAFDLMRTTINSIRAEREGSLDSSIAHISTLAHLNMVPHEVMAPYDGSTEADGGGTREVDQRIHDGISRVSSFAFFGLTFAASFSRGCFDVDKAEREWRNNAFGSHEELASARRELSISPSAGRLVVERFRSAWNIT
ncbi:hypothetical protein Pth03_11810 [Planotetraspora thailandica]|uniref:AAA+ ATPase domain-containing protein n=1 Tax=Planotetraspora thailandica TaxID=487172 RepID=A0A8J3XS45_9ACTN|nr:hypothetical protein [Planotetraspora thailandica]GII52792.1 hypothetical protein Pth03_11810 [Planotetraspora thailandica]